jgi:hypothetical protein
MSMKPRTIVILVLLLVGVLILACVLEGTPLQSPGLLKRSSGWLPEGGGGCSPS